MTYYFVSFEKSKFTDIVERFPALADGIWIKSAEDLRAAVLGDSNDLCFFIQFSSGNKDLDSWVMTIRDSAPTAKIIFVTSDLKPGELKAHQLSPVGGDAYVSKQVTADTLERILSGFQNELTNVRGNKLESTGAHKVREQFELDSIIEMKNNSLSQELDAIFAEGIPQTKEKPKFQSLSNLAPSEEDEAGVDLMSSDNDKELSLNDLGDLELSSEADLPPDAPADEGGLDLNLDAGMDLNLDDGTAPPADDNLDSGLSLGELDLGGEEEILAPPPPAKKAAKPLPPPVEDDAGLTLSDGTSAGLDFSLDGEMSPDAKDKLAEIDAIMEEDSKIMNLGGDMDLLADEDAGADLMTGTGKPAAAEVESEGDALDFGSIDDSLAESSGESADALSLDGDDAGFAIADLPAAGGEDVLDSDLDQPLVSDDLDLANLDFGSESEPAEETVVVRKAKPPVAPAAVEEEPEIAVAAEEEEEKTQTRVRKKKKDKEEKEPSRIMQVERPMGEELREISGAYSAELERMKATLSNLRTDREELLKKIQNFEEEKLLQNRQALNMRAELDEKKIELSIVRKKLNEDISDLKDKVRLEEERRLILEEKNRVLREELEKSEQKTKIDVKKVMLRERELEQKLELLKADAETQIRNRDLKILELKRKIDGMEFDMESMQTQEKRTVESRFELEDKLEKAIKTLRGAISVLEDETDKGAALDALKKNIDM